MNHKIYLLNKYPFFKSYSETKRRIRIRKLGKKTTKYPTITSYLLKEQFLLTGVYQRKVTDIYLKMHTTHS